MGPHVETPYAELSGASTRASAKPPGVRSHLERAPRTCGIAWGRLVNYIAISEDVQRSRDSQVPLKFRSSRREAWIPMMRSCG
jgi:hypothetical protein